MEHIYYYDNNTLEYNNYSFKNNKFEELPINATNNRPNKQFQKNMTLRFIDNKWKLFYKFEENIYLKKDFKDKHRGESVGIWSYEHGCYLLNGNIFTNIEEFNKDIYSTDNREQNYITNKISRCENLITYIDYDYKWVYINEYCKDLNTIYLKLEELNNLRSVKNSSGTYIVSAGNITDTVNSVFKLNDINNAIESIKNYNPKLKAKINNNLIDILNS